MILQTPRTSQYYPSGCTAHAHCARHQTAGALSGGPLTHAPQPRARATTHTDLQLRARALGVAVRVVHNASIMSAVGACGLQLYRYGEASAHCLVRQCQGAKMHV